MTLRQTEKKGINETFSVCIQLFIQKSEIFLFAVNSRKHISIFV